MPRKNPLHYNWKVVPLPIWMSIRRQVYIQRVGLFFPPPSRVLVNIHATQCRPAHPIPVQCWASIAAHCWFNAGKLYSPLAQHWNRIWWLSRVYVESAQYSAQYIGQNCTLQTFWGTVYPQHRWQTSDPTRIRTKFLWPDKDSNQRPLMCELQPGPASITVIWLVNKMAQKRL